MRPRIGITTSYDDGRQTVDHRYVTAIEEAGGRPVLLPMLERDATYEAYSPLIDGLVIIGGPAVTDGLVGSLADELDPPPSVQDSSDRQWIHLCRKAEHPILGICYGMQVLNALADGTIYGDVEKQLDASGSHSQKRDGTTHPILLDDTSRLRRLLGTESITVNTRHLQAVASVGTDFRVVARAPDGVIEAIEHTSDWVVGVQFHPERMGAVTQPLFEALVDQARARARAPSP